jgi:hypothetical protein
MIAQRGNLGSDSLSGVATQVSVRSGQTLPDGLQGGDVPVEPLHDPPSYLLNNIVVIE